MADAKAIYLYHDYLDLLGGYTMEERGRLITAMLEYSVYGTLPEFEGPERYIWPALRGQIDRDREKYQNRCKQNAANARRKRNEQSATEDERQPF